MVPRTVVKTIFVNTEDVVASDLAKLWSRMPCLLYSMYVASDEYSVCVNY